MHNGELRDIKIYIPFGKVIDKHPPPLEAEHAVAALVHKSLQVCGGHLNNTLTFKLFL